MRLDGRRASGRWTVDGGRRQPYCWTRRARERKRRLGSRIRVRGRPGRLDEEDDPWRRGYQERRRAYAYRGARDICAVPSPHDAVHFRLDEGPAGGRVPEAQFQSKFPCQGSGEGEDACRRGPGEDEAGPGVPGGRHREGTEDSAGGGGDGGSAARRQ